MWVESKECTNPALYLYGFTRAGWGTANSFKPGSKVTGEGETVELKGNGVDEQHAPWLWRYREIAAVLSRVSLDEFSGPGAEAHLQELAWLGPRACRHQAVVQAVKELGPVLPARFGTLFLSFISLESLLRQHHDTIVRFLDRVADQEEWAVKGFWDRTQAENARLAQVMAPEIEPLASFPGRRYLQEQRLRREVRLELATLLESIGRQIAADLSRQATDYSPHRLPASEAAGKDSVMILNWAFLVPRNRESDFQATLQRANAEQAKFGLRLELSGPWPPYTFCPRLEPEAEKA